MTDNFIRSLSVFISLTIVFDNTEIQPDYHMNLNPTSGNIRLELLETSYYRLENSLRMIVFRERNPKPVGSFLLFVHYFNLVLAHRLTYEPELLLVAIHFRQRRYNFSVEFAFIFKLLYCSLFASTLK